MTQLPKSLEKCPIIDAIIEVRFDTGINPNAVFGMIYSQIKELFPGEVMSLPISQMPLEIMMGDSNLRYKPLFRIDGIDSSLQIGPHVIAVNSYIPYIGWSRFYDVFDNIITQVYGTIGKVLRLGLRYINFFNQDIHENVEVDFKLANKECHNFLINAEIADENHLVNMLQYTPNATAFSAKEGKDVTGSIIDIDTYRIYEQGCDKGCLVDDLTRAHDSEKNLFYSLLKSELLKQLEPVY